MRDRRLARMVQVCNRIVHGYSAVGFEVFWRDLPAGIAALIQFAASLAARMGPSPGG